MSGKSRRARDGCRQRETATVLSQNLKDSIIIREVFRKGLGSVLVGEKGLKLLQCKRGESFQLQQRQPATPSLCVCVCVSSTCQLLYECLWLCCGLGLLSS